MHVPVLAGELIDLTAPAAGETAVDCTFGAGGHARLVAERLGPTGTLVCIDRDPAAEERFEELASEAPCDTRFLRMNYADGLELLADEGTAADLVYLDLGISSMQVDARERPKATRSATTCWCIRRAGWSAATRWTSRCAPRPAATGSSPRRAPRASTVPKASSRGNAPSSTVGAGARLEWLPLEAICYSGCRAENRLTLQRVPKARS